MSTEKRKIRLAIRATLAKQNLDDLQLEMDLGLFGLAIDATATALHAGVIARSCPHDEQMKNA